MKTCKNCKGRLDRGQKTYCSKLCQYASQKSNVTATCENCGKVYKTIPSRIAYGRKYCSGKCQAAGAVGREPHNKIGLVVPCEVCGKEFGTTPGIRKQGRGKYCSQKCFRKAFPEKLRGKYTARIDRVCEWCKKDFWVIKSWLKDGGGRFCSYDCMNEWKRSITGEDHPLWKPKVTIECETCGETFERKPSESDSRFCSVECADIAKTLIRGEDHPRWMPLVTLVCEFCQREYERKPWEVERSRFCSRRCVGSWVVQNIHGRTSIEIQVSEWLDEMEIEYEEQGKVDQWVCDFVVEDLKLVIEADGTYWHSLEKNILRDNQKNHMLERMGYFVLRLPEKDINERPDWCIGQIKEHL